ncbi:RbsD/FucU family protein [Vibrio neonatus]|uniref:RbsD/FucU family protein n=1 Tax=Vibrio neonatus TaxID=278860 RepID=UPI0021C4B7AE|nr:RbsD/FucU family protein [Vibrio neonatus]
MIKSSIIHPELLSVLAKCGHKTQILIADSNFSFVTNSNPRTEIIYLNFAPDMLNAVDVLNSITKLINVEASTMMAWPDDFENTIHAEYENLLPQGTPMSFQQREDFYQSVKSPNTLLIIATGESRRFANLLLTVGVVK